MFTFILDHNALIGLTCSFREFVEIKKSTTG